MVLQPVTKFPDIEYNWSNPIPSILIQMQKIKHSTTKNKKNEDKNS